MVYHIKPQSKKKDHKPSHIAAWDRREGYGRLADNGLVKDAMLCVRGANRRRSIDSGMMETRVGVISV